LRKQKVVSGWVVYRPQLSGPGTLAVCEQEEWDAMELAEPGRHALLRAGIASEAEAEALARELQGGAASKGVRPKGTPPKAR
jgi:hypothetical protein